MNLRNFENQINDTILMRGFDYYKSGNIISLEYENHEWVAEVEGSYDYTVTVKLTDSDDITNTCCNCPYDMGIYCKHQAAVFYALKKDKQRNKTEKKPNNNKFGEVVNKLDKQTLVKIILDITNGNSRIRDELLLIYGDKEDSKHSSRKIIRASINQFKRYDYIDYDNAWQATKGVETVMRMVDAKIAIDDIETAVTICIVILEEMMEWAEYLSDYCDVVYEIVDNTIEQIRETIESAEIDEESNAIFEIVYKHAMSDIYDDGLSWRVDLLSAIVPLCSIKANRDKVEQYITFQMDADNDLNVYEYEYRALQELQYSILLMYENDSAAEEYLQQHLDNPEFRRIATENAMLEKKYERVEQLCLEGERSCTDYGFILAV
ncbi:MAG: SWIM zinc finger family protein [Oscillospiraceae bacterium]|nr:SWIM zinc finger family protein [Oscillospiraceae bacterium]